MNNRRAYKRCAADGEGNVTTETGNLCLHLINISASGALISVPKKLSINVRHRFEFEIQIQLVRFHFQTEAKIVRLHFSDGSQHLYGIQFINLEDKFRVEIDEVINRSYPAEDNIYMVS